MTDHYDTPTNDEAALEIMEEQGLGETSTADEARDRIEQKRQRDAIPAQLSPRAQEARSVDSLLSDAVPVPVDDLMPDYIPPTVDAKSADVLATKIALQSGDPKLAFDSSRAQLEEGEYELTALEAIKAEEQGLMRETKIDILADESLTDEQKAEAMRTAAEDELSIDQRLSLDALANAQEGASEAKIESVGMLAPQVDAVLQYKKYQDSVATSVRSSTDIGWTSGLMDLLEIIVPGLEQGSVALLRDDIAVLLGSEDPYERALGAAKSFAFMGSGRQDIRERLQAMPLEQRKEFLPKFIEIIQGGSNIVRDENDLLLLANLNSALGNDFDEMGWEALDTATSVLDAAAVAGMVVGAAKGIGRISGAIEASKGVTIEGKVLDEAITAESIAERLQETAPAGSKTTVQVGNESVTVGPMERAVRQMKDVEAPDEAADVAEVAARDNMRRSVVSEEVPTSAKEIYKVTDEASHNSIIKAIDDGGDEAASKLAGTTRVEALAAAHLPDVASVSGSVKSNPWIGTVDQAVMDTARTGGLLDYTAEEIADMTRRVLDRVGAEPKVKGLAIRQAPVKVKADDVVEEREMAFEMVVGTDNFTSFDPDRLMDTVAAAYAKHGIDRSQLTLVEKVGDEFIPTGTDIRRAAPEGVEELSPMMRELRGIVDAPKNKEYFVKVESRHRFMPSDLGSDEYFDVSSSLFGGAVGGDRNSGTWSAARMFTSPSTLFGDSLFTPALRAVDRESHVQNSLKKLATDFTKPFSKLKEEKRKAITNLLFKHNDKGVRIKEKHMVEIGLTEHEQSIIRSFQTYWDTAFNLENLFLSRALGGRGWGFLTSKAQDTKLLAKPIGIQEFAKTGKEKKFFNPDTDKVEPLSQKKLDELYENGGTIVELREPVVIKNKNKNDNHVRYAIAKSEVDSSYWRPLKEGDQVLQYREGYFPRVYTSNKFIVIKDQDGFEEVIGTSASSAGARAAMMDEAAKRGLKPGKYEDSDWEISFRGDKDMDLSVDELDDYMSMNRGRMNQRRRGEKLANFDDMVRSLDTGDLHMKSPIDTMIDSTRSLAQRVTLGDTFEVMKAKAMKQWPKAFPAGSWPSRATEVGVNGQMGQKYSRDARATWEYITSLETVRVNAVDAGFKTVLNTLALGLGKANNKALSSAEQGVLWAAKNVTPAALSRNLAFTALIVMNPLRQLALQGSQSLILGARFPDQIASLPKDMAVVLGTAAKNKFATTKMGKGATISDSEAAKILDEFVSSGLSDAVDQHVLVRGAITQMTNDAEMVATGRSIVGKGVGAVRKAGFAAGERYQLLASYMAHRKAFIKGGGEMSPKAVEEIAAQARNFTLSMNKAGEMGMNQGTLGLVYQFMTVPHKAIVENFSKSLSWRDKAALTSSTVMFYGVPAWVASSVIGSESLEAMPEPVKEAAEEGIVGYTLNGLMSQITGEETRVNYQGMGIMDAYGMYEFTKTLISLSLMDMIEKTPLAASWDRILQPAKTTLALLNPAHEMHDVVTPRNVMIDTANIFGFLSPFFKHKYIDGVTKAYSRSGSEMDDEVSSGEEIMAMFGLPTMDAEMIRYLNNKDYVESKAFKDDVRGIYKEAKRILGQQDVVSGTLDYTAEMAALASAISVYKDTPQAFAEEFMKNLDRDQRDGDLSLFNSIMHLSNIKTPAEIRARINADPRIPDEDKESLVDFFDTVDSLQPEAQ